MHVNSAVQRLIFNFYLMGRRNPRSSIPSRLIQFFFQKNLYSYSASRLSARGVRGESWAAVRCPESSGSPLRFEMWNVTVDKADQKIHHSAPITNNHAKHTQHPRTLSTRRGNPAGVLRLLIGFNQKISPNLPAEIAGRFFVLRNEFTPENRRFLHRENEDHEE
jgi:hypothetical protein